MNYGIIIDTSTWDLPDIGGRGVLVTAVLTGAALLASIVVYVIRQRYTARQLKKLGEDAIKMSKAVTAILLTGISALFTGLGYLIFLAQSNTDFLSTLPFVGKHVWGVIGVAVILYDLRLNKTFKTVTGVLGKWSKRDKKAPVPTTPPAQEQLPETSSDFLG